MAMNLDAAIRLSAQVSGANNIRSMETGLQGLQRATQLSKADLGKWNIEINRAARESGNTVAGIRAHAKALGDLRERVDIGSNAYKRLGNEIAAANAKLKQLQAENLSVNINTTSSGGGGAAGIAAGLAAGAGVGVAASAVRSAGALRLLASGFDESTMSAQRFALVMNQAPGSSAAKLQAQIQGLRTQLAALKIQSDEYVSTLTRVRELETLQSFRSGRAEAIANNRAMSGATISRGYGSNARLAALPNTIAADNVRVAELTQRMQNLTRNTLEYNAARREMAVVQSRLSADNAVPIMGGVAGIAATAGVAVAGAVAMSAAQNTLELEKQARAVRTLTSDYGAMSVAIQEMVRQQGYQISTADATAQAYEVLSSGFTKQADVVKILRAASDGATGGFASMSQVVDGTTSVLNAYSRGADDARRVVDAFIKVQNDGKIKVGEFADQIGRVAPTAVAAGISLEEMLAGLSSATALSLKPEQAITGLNQALVSIIRPTDQARALAEKLGLEFSAQALRAKGLSGFLADVKEKTKGSTSALNILFSDMDGAKFVQVQTNNNLEKMNQNLENQRNNINDAAAAAKTAVDPLLQFNNAWKDLTITFTSGALPALTDAVQLLTQMIGLLTGPQAKAAIGFGVELSGWLLNPGLKAQSMTLFGGGGPSGSAPARSGGRGGSAAAWRNAQQRGDIRPPSRPVDPAMEAAALAVLNGGSGKGDKPSKSEIKEAQLAAIRRRPYGRDLIAAAEANGIDPLLFAGLVQQESGFSQSAISRSGAIGLAQLMPGTARDLGVNPRNAQQNLFGGAKYLRQQIDKFGLEGGLRAYNQGPGNQQRNPGGVSQEAREYPGRVLANARRFGFGGDGSAEGMAAIENMAKLRQERADALRDAREQVALKQNELDIEKAGDELAKLKITYEGRYQQLVRDTQKQKAEAKSLEEQQQIDLAAGLENERLSLEYGRERLKILEQQRDVQAEIPGLMRAAGEEAGKTFAIIQQQQALTVGEGLSAGLNGYIESVGSAGEQTKAFVEQGLGGLSDAIVELSTSGADGFGSFVSSLLKDMARLVIQTQVLLPLLRALTGGGSAPLAFTPGLNLGGGGFGGGGAGFFDAGFAPGLNLGFAKGGIASGPRSGFPAMLHGTEAVIPLPNGRSVPVQVKGGRELPPMPFSEGDSLGGGDMPVIPTVVINRTEYATVDQLGKVAAAAEARTLQKIRTNPSARRRAGIG